MRRDAQHPKHIVCLLQPLCPGNVDLFFVMSFIAICHLFILGVQKHQESIKYAFIFFNKDYRFDIKYLVLKFEEGNGTRILDILYCLVVLLASHKGLWHFGASQCYRRQLDFVGLYRKLLFSLSFENRRCLQCA